MILTHYPFAEPACRAFAQWLTENPAADDDERVEVARAFAEDSTPHWFAQIDDCFEAYPHLLGWYMRDPDLSGDEDMHGLYGCLAAFLSEVILDELLELNDQRQEGEAA